MKWLINVRSDTDYIFDRNKKSTPLTAHRTERSKLELITDLRDKNLAVYTPGYNVYTLVPMDLVQIILEDRGWPDKRYNTAIYESHYIADLVAGQVAEHIYKLV